MHRVCCASAINIAFWHPSASEINSRTRGSDYYSSQELYGICTGTRRYSPRYIISEPAWIQSLVMMKAFSSRRPMHFLSFFHIHKYRLLLCGIPYIVIYCITMDEVGSEQTTGSRPRLHTKYTHTNTTRIVHRSFGAVSGGR